MPATKYLVCLWVFACLALANVAHALELAGMVQEENGQPVAGAMVMVESPNLNALRITTYTASNGHFAFPDTGTTQIPAKAISIQKIGYLQSGAPKIKLQGKHQTVSIRAKRIDNVADQVPPSAWLAGLPDTPDGHLVIRCADCHQFPFAKAKDYIQKFAMLPAAEREKVWRDVMKFMRVKGMSIAPGGMVDVSKLPLTTFEDDRISGFGHADEARIATVLTKYMPLKFDSYRLADYEKLLARVGGPGTVIREYQLPAPVDSMFHDSAVVRKADGTLYSYSADWVNPRMARLNPLTGEFRVLPLPKGLAGLHTLVPDHDGNLWATFQISGHLGRFDVNSETWTTWTAGKSGWAEQGSSGNGLIHSIAYKAGFEVGFDVHGGVWSSLTGTNQLIRIEPKTGRTDIVDAPGTGEAATVGDRTLLAGIYGLVMQANGEKIWVTQLMGSVFSVNTETLKVEDVIPIARGDAPRRLTIDKDDVLYVPLHGAGQLLVYDTRAKKELGRYPLPDRAAAPYAANWDAFRNAVWMGGANAAKVYKFDVASKSFTEYPLPMRDGMIVRSFPIDQKSGDVYFSYAPVAALKDGAHRLVWLHPDDAEVIKKP